MHLRSAFEPSRIFIIHLSVFFFSFLKSQRWERERNHTRQTLAIKHGHRIHAGFFKLHGGEIEITAAQQQTDQEKKTGFHSMCKKKKNKMLTYKREMYPQMRYCHLSYRQNVYVLRLDPIRQSRFTDFHRSKIIFFLLNFFFVSTITRNTRMQSFQAHFRLHFHFASAGILKTRRKKMISLTWKMDRWKKKIHEVKILKKWFDFRMCQVNNTRWVVRCAVSVIDLYTRASNRKRRKKGGNCCCFFRWETSLSFTTIISHRTEWASQKCSSEQHTHTPKKKLDLHFIA